MDSQKCRSTLVILCGTMLAASLASLAACGGGGASTAPTPVAGPVTAPPSARDAAPTLVDDEVSRTKFAAVLGVDLTKMVRRPTGLYVQDAVVGTGSIAARTRTATVRYVGYLSDGTRFDSGEITITLGNNKVIRAWEDGVLGMRAGGRRRLVTPPHLAYGAKGAPPTIPPNAVLVFDMELLQVY